MTRGKKAFTILTAFCFLCLLVFSGCSQKELTCPCNCEDCLWAPSSQHLFTFPKDSVRDIRLVTEEKYTILEAQDAETAIDILNSFTSVSSEPAGETVDGGYLGRVRFTDFVRRFTFTEDSIIINDIRYVGEPGSLEPLIALYEDAPAQPRAEI